MRYSKERLSAIYRRTDENCHICHRKLAFKNYGQVGTRGAWHVEHSRPRALGGSDHRNNLYAAHVSCNVKKGIGSTRAARAQNGKTRAPHSTTKKAAVRAENAVTGLVGGALAGGALGGPPRAVLGALFGGMIGNERRVV